MKPIQVIAALGLAVISIPSFAQEKGKGKKVKYISISPNAIKIGNDSADLEAKKEEKPFEIEVGMVELGINALRDQTDYNSQEAKNFLRVDATQKNENLFTLDNAKSINVNVYPILAKFRLSKTEKQKIYLSTGVGLQMYNFRFSKDIVYVDSTPSITMSPVPFTKNKLAFTYLSVPLMATFKTKLAEKAWLVYGVGITGGYRIASWTKHVSGEEGKVKNHDKFNFSDFNSCLTAEIGLDNYFRLYASYQLTPMHENALVQNPYCIGFRIGGM
ncbi:outer membrane beta-barrel protein [Polluticoccus soli]|uniref:outer membrane beta-barrel protein n=1 Tax=Polluticoccus soli TaxID=3034150 RepID=UPI0023E0CFE8|nr:outer membrane beta-barrel protein [Flavipsychrobacter sp. JY13-12]